MQFFNPQTLVVDRNVAASINIANPSKTAFMYVWGYSLSPNANANIGFTNGNGGGTLGGYQSVGVGTSLTLTSMSTGGPIFTVDPNVNLVIGNPNTAGVSGWVKISN